MNTTDVQPARIRHEWVDAAKGFCMMLVVLLHTAERFEFEMGLGTHAFWSQVSLFFNPVRMPLFFFISGFLVSSAMGRSLGQTRSRTLGMAFIYTLWTAIVLGRLLIPMARGGQPLPSAVEFALALILPTNYWYLYALPLYFLVAWGLTRALGSRRVYALIPLSLLSVISFLPFFRPKLDEPLDALMIGAVCANAVWFFLGITAKGNFSRVMARAKSTKLTAALLAYAALFVGAQIFDLVSELKFVMSISVLAVAAQLFGLLKFQGPTASAFKWVGKQTLPVYLFHVLFLAGFGAAFRLTNLDALTASSPALWAGVLIPIMTVCLIVGSALLGKAIRSSRARWLLEAPAWVVRVPAHRASSRA